MFRKLITVGVVALSLSVAGCSSDDDDDTAGTDMSETDPTDETDGTDPDAAPPVATPGEGNSVYDNIVNNADLSTLRAAIDAAGLADTLDNEASEFTIFAPNNAAFLALDAGLLPTLLADPTGQLTSVLTYHVVAGTTDAAGATAAAPTDLVTLNGATVALAASDTGLTIGGANIIGADSNYDAESSVGVVHVIDAVLIPQ